MAACPGDFSHVYPRDDCTMMLECNQRMQNAAEWDAPPVRALFIELPRHGRLENPIFQDGNFYCLHFACAAFLILFQLVHEKQLVQCRRWGTWVRWLIVFVNNTLTFVVMPYAATGKFGIGFFF